jgi:Ring finger domain
MSVDNACPICMDTFHGNRSVGCTVPCGHLFHRRCFETWQMHSSSGKCPCCMMKMTGFIDKIHITLPTAVPRVLDCPTLSIHRRKVLSIQKCKRSAMMRHSERRKPTSSLALVQTRAIEDEGRDDSSVVRLATVTLCMSPYMSLNAALQRIPPPDVKTIKPDSLSLSSFEDQPERIQSSYVARMPAGKASRSSKKSQQISPSNSAKLEMVDPMSHRRDKMSLSSLEPEWSRSSPAPRVATPRAHMSFSASLQRIPQPPCSTIVRAKKLDMMSHMLDTLSVSSLEDQPSHSSPSSPLVRVAATKPFKSLNASLQPFTPPTCTKGEPIDLWNRASDAPSLSSLEDQLNDGRSSPVPRVEAAKSYMSLSASLQRIPPRHGAKVEKPDPANHVPDISPLSSLEDQPYLRRSSAANNKEAAAQPCKSLNAPMQKISPPPGKSSDKVEEMGPMMNCVPDSSSLSSLEDHRDSSTSTWAARVPALYPYPLSLNASLPRVPGPRQRKSAKLEELETMPSVLDRPSFSMVEEKPDRNRSLLDTATGTDDMSEQVPDVAESIMQNIESVIREIQSPTRRFRKQPSFGSTQRLGQIPSSRFGRAKKTSRGGFLGQEQTTGRGLAIKLPS